ncbi:MAG: DUF4349 domain-containing protein [Epulopiscium sp.]|nr:DUF4349 domain-containing protein [Candidatus Epulonipiscium sp.]
MNKSFRNILLAITLITVFITGCGANKDFESAPMEDYGVSNQEADEEMAIEEEMGFEGSRSHTNQNQKLIYRANISIEVAQKLDPLVKSIETFVGGHEGYIESMEQYQIGHDPITDQDLHNMYIRIRIPHNHYNKAMQTIEEMGTVTNKSTSAEDVTLQYSDIESTLKMYKVEQERLLKMLESENTDIKDMIEIEKRLSEIRIELEKHESARRALESQINYDTIELEITQVRRESDINSKNNFSGKIKHTFIKSIDTIIVVSQAFILAVTYMLLPMLILAAIAGVFYMIFHKVKKKRKK